MTGYLAPADSQACDAADNLRIARLAGCCGTSGPKRAMGIALDRFVARRGLSRDRPHVSVCRARPSRASTGLS